MPNNYLEKKISCKVQFTTTSPRPGDVKEWFEKLLALHLPEDTYYVKWSGEEETDE